MISYVWELNLYDNNYEVSGAHVKAVVCRIQGGAGPEGCDTAHWCDVLLC